MKLLLLFTLLLVGCAQVEQVAPEIVETAQQAIEDVPEDPAPLELSPTVIVAFGDSLTAGPVVKDSEAYPAHLERVLRAEGYDVTVINEGSTGETSSGALERLDEILAYEPDIVVLETGVNDILLGISTETTRANINQIIDTLQENNITVVLAGMEARGTFQGYSFQVETIYPTIAEEQNIPFIPFFLEGVAGDPNFNLPDRVHPNAEGYRIVAEQNVLPVVEPLLQDTKRI